MDSLSIAIENYYTSFSDTRPPDDIAGCPCCIDDNEIDILLRTPLREIAPESLTAYAASAFLTVGGVDDYLYFLPRIMEISISDDSWWPDIEITARAINSTDLSTWPENRRQALSALLDAKVDQIIDSGSYSEIDAWLCAIARIDLNLRPYLAKIEKREFAMKEYFEINRDCLKNDKLCNAFWELPNEGHETIVQWFKSEPIREIVDPCAYVL